MGTTGGRIRRCPFDAIRTAWYLETKEQLEIPTGPPARAHQNVVLLEPPDLGQVKIHPIGLAFWSAVQRLAEQKIGVAISAATPYLFLPSTQPAN